MLFARCGDSGFCAPWLFSFSAATPRLSSQHDIQIAHEIAERLFAERRKLPTS